MVVVSPTSPATSSSTPCTSAQAPATDPQSIVAGLTSKPHLHRERSLAHFRANLPTWPEPELNQAKSLLLSLLDPSQTWEAIYGGLKGTTVVVEQRLADDAFTSAAVQQTTALISHSEARVRTATSALLGALAAVHGARIWEAVGPRLLRAVAENLQLDEAQRLREAARVAERDLDTAAADAKLNGLRMVHETEGWRGLETSLLALADLLDGCGGELLAPAAAEGRLDAVDGLPELIGFVVRAKDHPNRFVREAELKLLNSVAKATGRIAVGDGQGGVVALQLVAGVCMPVILEGLQDNWSQVRYAASTAVRTVLEGLPIAQRRRLYPELLPRMCLNRHYVAEGVRNLSQDTWRRVISSDGRKYLVLGLENCIAFYETQCEADNHAVREAACQGLGELCAQLPRSAIEPLVPRIVGALVTCFKDESWPVRDHACRALGGVVATFPCAAEQSGRLGEVHALFEQHLADNIPSVRANCATALAMAVLSFDNSHAVFGSQRALTTAARLLSRLEHQPEQRFAVADAPDRDTGFGSASKVARDNDAELHTDQTTYSCGSLAPKLRRGAGCMDHGFARERRPWEEADGGLRLWTALAAHGASGAWDMVGDVVTAGEVGSRLSFAQEMRVRQGWLECFAEAVKVLGRGGLAGEVVARVVGVIEVCRRMENQGVKVAAANCARAVRRIAGLAAYAKAETAASEQKAA